MTKKKEQRNKEIDEGLNSALIDSLKESSSAGGALKKTDSLYFIPILRRPFFPGMAAPIVVEPGPVYDLIKEVAKEGDKTIGLLLTKEEDTDPLNVKFKDLFKVGVAAKILRIIPMEQGGAQVILSMEGRVKLKKTYPKEKQLRADVVYIYDEAKLTKTLKAYATSIISTIKELLKVNPLFKEELQIFLGHSDFTEPGRLADFAVALTTATRFELQEVLETFDVQKRIDKALILLRKELDLSQLQNSINQKIDATINKNQKDFFLKEQLKTIKKELGIEKDDRSIDREKFEARFENKDVPAHVMEVIQEELDKLYVLEAQSAEYGVSRAYLDWLTILPWGVHGKDRHNLRMASKILNEDHYGLEDIKTRILEFISVSKLKGELKGSIICLVGPPGVGKTSIGKSIARALNRKFYRFSVGGMRDEAEIKGHRRTYIGSMPGKLVQALKSVQTMNPVIMLDEVDKIGSSFQGDPASALLEVLDPEQNSQFLDHYLDVRLDLSSVLFIVTANVLDNIPEPLIDRMETMRLSGYILEEKVEIARKYLIPRNRKLMGLRVKDVTFNTYAIKAIINGYAREAGVRNLENLIKKILRKVASRIVRATQAKKQTMQPIKITAGNVHEFLGKPIFTSDRYFEKTPVGVATGLAWTALGGATLYIETLKVPSEKTEMKLTGQAGQVMKESSEIAFSYLHSAFRRYTSERPFFEKSQVHIHIPEGATPKDGPSAGVTMVTALLSLLTDCQIKQNLGMTGEITLTGRVLAVGGIKEKLIAAKRSGLEEIILPKDNLRDYEELPPYIKEGLSIHFVSHYDEVVPLAFGDELDE